MEWTITADAPGKVCLMQGNEAVVRGAVEAGLNFAASYPGSPSSQVLGLLGKIAKERNFYAEWSTNEVCALEACIGASLANARSLCIVKQNGLLCVADALHCGAQHVSKAGLSSLHRMTQVPTPAPMNLILAIRQCPLTFRCSNQPRCRKQKIRFRIP